MGKTKALYKVNVTEPPEEQPQTPSETTGVNFGDVSAAYTYDANDRLLTDSRGDRTSTYTYNKAGLVTNLSNTKGNSYDYTYRLDGNQIKESNDDYDTYYRYNDIGQLVYEFEDVTAITYTYDTRGNRISLFTDDDNYTTIYKYDKNNRLLSENKTSTGFDDVTDTTYNYDKNGNTLRKIIQRKRTPNAAYEPVNDITYSYNRRNELIYYDNIEGEFDNESQCGYKYDAIGRLRNKHDEEGGDIINYYWDGSNIVWEEKYTRNDVYFRGINMIAQNAGETTSYYVYNAHGDTTSLVNSSGSVVRTYDNDAFGNSTANYGTGATTSFRYNGQYTDIDTGLIYLRNRFYDPTTGRFTQEDTYWNVNNMIYGDSNSTVPSYSAIAQSGNLYVYCMNNPVKYSDILGLASYIIYDINGTSGDGSHTFRDEAEIRKRQLEETWGTEVYILAVSDAQEFKDAWNYRVGYDWDGYDVSVEEVVIIAHGSITDDGGQAQGYFYFGDKDSKIYAYSNVGDNNDTTVWNLSWKQMEYLNFSVCNSGNPDVYNLAYAFQCRMTINQYIVAWDGGTIFNYNTGQLEPGGYDGWYKELYRQNTWYRFVEKDWRGKPVRQRIGCRYIQGRRF